ncbi:MAG TPA: hypothetical protein VGM19_11430 [Armatimonadota bacterium]|jgi:Tol biopolymer transport system component
MKAPLRFVAVVLSLLVLVGLVVGCGGGGGGAVFLNVFQRTSWAQTLNGPITLTSYGGNRLLYIYSISSNGSDVALLTPSLNNANNLLEGGQNSVYSPDAATIAFASRRATGGNTGASLALYTMSAANGDRSGLTKITDDAGAGADTQPSYSPDGTKIIYSTTRDTGRSHIRLANADGSGGITDITPPSDSRFFQWPVFNPTNPDQIAVQVSATDPVVDPNAQIAIYTISTATLTPATASTFFDGGPSWSPDGTKIAFHSNRTGDFDLWIVTVAGGGLTHVTSDARSDGFPVWNQTGSLLAFTRDRELWTTTPDGVTQKQLSSRF